MILSGNTGKARIQRALLGLPARTRILDVGAVGPTPLELWRDLPLGEMDLDVCAIDPDAEGVRNARELDLPIEVRCLSGYELTKHLEAGKFDIVVCTQVLEHVADPARLLSEIRAMLYSGGKLWMTVDSAHFGRSHHGDPLWKRFLRPTAARLSERYYDFGLTKDRLERLLVRAGFRNPTIWPCNLGPIKPLMSKLTDREREIFIPRWLDFEMSLERDGFDKPDLFRALYVEAQAASRHSSHQW